MGRAGRPRLAVAFAINLFMISYGLSGSGLIPRVSAAHPIATGQEQRNYTRTSPESYLPYLYTQTLSFEADTELYYIAQLSSRQTDRQTDSATVIINFTDHDPCMAEIDGIHSGLVLVLVLV